MRPVCFSCYASFPDSPEVIAERILDLGNWSDFRGYGPLPGIERAEFQLRTPEIEGSRIAVVNTDGSRHVEEIVEWRLPERLTMHLKEFGAPLEWLADRFEETWHFERLDGKTKVRRAFAMYPKSNFSRLLLALIARFLKAAVARHLREMQVDEVTS